MVRQRVVTKIRLRNSQGDLLALLSIELTALQRTAELQGTFENTPRLRHILQTVDTIDDERVCLGR